MELDHIAVVANTLEEAVNHVESALGVSLQAGGQHAVFGTHNRLLGLADGLYLEAIATDPAAAPIGRARWFDLDRFSGPPRLSNWICSTSDISSSLTRLGPKAGQEVALARGDLRWVMAVPENGIMPFDNMFPALIKWRSPVHPSAMLADAGCVLRRLVVSHPEAARLRTEITVELRDPRVVFEAGPAGLRAEIDTPNGLRVLQ